MHSAQTPQTTTARTKKSGLRINNEIHINLQNVCLWLISEDSIQFQLTDQNIIDISLDGVTYNAGSIVPINEFKRIIREVNEYMGL